MTTLPEKTSLKFAPSQRGMTLIEVTLIVAVLIGLTFVLFQGTIVFKDGTNRVFCIQNIEKVQKSMRSYSNMNELFPGDICSGLKNQIIGINAFVQVEPVCPGEGSYTFGGDNIPDPGVTYMSCSIGTHIPSSTNGW